MADAPLHEKDSSTRFTALEIDIDSPATDRAANLTAGASHARPPKPRLQDPVCLRRLLAVSGAVIVALVSTIIIMAYWGSASPDGVPFGPVDAPGSLPAAIEIEALMKTLNDLQDVAMANNGSRCGQRDSTMCTCGSRMCSLHR
jgi:hypothetical protein